MVCATRIGPPADDAEMDWGAVSPDGTTLYLRPADDTDTINTYDWPALTGPSTLYTGTTDCDITGPVTDDTGRLFWIERPDGGATATLIRRWDGSASTINSTVIDTGDTGYICWYGGLLYVLSNTDGDGGLYSVDPDTGTAVLLEDLSTVGYGGGPVACPTGDLWILGGGSVKLIHYDVGTATLTTSFTAPVDGSQFLIPQCNGHVRWWEDFGFGVPYVFHDSAPDFTVTTVDCPTIEDLGMDDPPVNGQAYNPSLSVNLVQIEDAVTPFARALYQFEFTCGGGLRVGMLGMTPT